MIYRLTKTPHVSINTMKLLRDIYSLWTMRQTFAATDTVIDLTQLWHTLVVTRQELAPCLAIVLVLRSHGQTIFIQTLVII